MSKHLQGHHSLTLIGVTFSCSQLERKEPIEKVNVPKPETDLPQEDVFNVDRSISEI